MTETSSKNANVAHIIGVSLDAARSCKAPDDHPGWLSTGEYLAAALVLDKPAWLARRGYTALDAMARVQGGGWSLAELLVAARVVREQLAQE